MFFSAKKMYRNSFATQFSIISCVVIYLLFANSISAKSLETYKKNIKRIKADISALIISKDIEKADLEKKIFEEIPNLLPKEQKIEVDGITTEINNEWLHSEIKKYKEKTDDKQQRLILTAIYERLDAIELKINELENAVAAKNTKDEQKRKLSEILKREEFQKPSEEEESLIQRFLKWLSDIFNRNVPQQAQKPLPASNFGGVARVMQVIVYVLVIAAIIFLLYKFAPFFIKKIKQREKKEKKEKIILGEKIAANESSANLFNEAETLAREGNLRDAIRKGYVALLFELSERKLIGLAKHKTNRDYLRSVRKKRKLYENMNGLTRNYERHWYGFEEADEEDWEEFRTEYNEALKQK